MQSVLCDKKILRLCIVIFFTLSANIFQIMSDVYDPPDRVAAESHCRGMNKYNEMYNESLDDPKKFWSRICQQFYWKSPIPEGEGLHRY